MASPKTLLLLGGTWHKFDQFAASCGPQLALPGGSVETAYNPGVTARLADGSYGLVAMYTCLSATKEDGSPAETLFHDEHAAPLAAWVAAGGALLMIHSACVACQTSPALRRLAGGVFVEHPPAFHFTVYPTFDEHPITAGVGAFSVYDEFYIEHTEPDVRVHMIALDRGVAYPMLWTRRQGAGRVAHIALGHDERVWNLPPYQQLLRQAAAWLTPAE